MDRKKAGECASGGFRNNFVAGAGGREATSSAPTWGARGNKVCANSAGQKVCCERADQTFGRFAAVALLLSIGGARGAFCLAERGEGSDGGESVMLLTSLKV